MNETMDQTTFAAAFFTFLGTSVAAWLTYKATSGKQKKDFIEKLLEECQKLRDELGKKDEFARKKDNLVLQLQSEVKKLQKEVHQLRDQLRLQESTRVPSDSPQIMEVVFNSMPKPIWIHEVGQNKWYVNDLYAQMFSIRRKDFWTPINIFQFYPAERAAHFVNNDMQVIESNVGKFFEEEFPCKIMEPVSNENPTNKWDVVKIPVRAGGRNYVVGFCANDKINQTIIDYYKFGAIG